MIKLFESFNKIEDLCEEYNIHEYYINPDGSIIACDSVYLDNERLKKIPLNFIQVKGAFDCSGNFLTSLKGAPKKVDGGFNCGDNELTSLQGCPEEVGSWFCCYINQLTSLEGAPRKINGDFECHDNQIWTFEGAPDYISGFFYCDGNPIHNIWGLFEDYSKIELFNYYDIIREVDGKPAIILDRLNDFLEEIGENPVEKVNGYINI